MRALLVVAVLAFATAALARITGPIGGAGGVYPGGPELGITGAATGSGGGGGGCNGTIDLSTGCAMPMLGVL